MILSLVVLGPVLAFSLWAFVRSTPPGARPGARWYNLSVIVLGVLLCAGCSVWTYRRMAGSVDAPWWPVIAGLASLVIFPAWLLLGGLLRNFVFFRGQRASPD